MNTLSSQVKVTVADDDAFVRLKYNVLHSFFNKNVFFLAQAEYPYFSADFRLKIFLHYTLFFVRIYFIRISRLKFAKF